MNDKTHTHKMYTLISVPTQLIVFSHVDLTFVLHNSWVDPVQQTERRGVPHLIVIHLLCVCHFRVIVCSVQTVQMAPFERGETWVDRRYKASQKGRITIFYKERMHGPQLSRVAIAIDWGCHIIHNDESPQR